MTEDETTPTVEIMARTIASVLKILEDRRSDLAFCNKDDDCHVGARWFKLAIADIGDSFVGNLGRE